jgi:hypothetical protein
MYRQVRCANATRSQKRRNSSKHIGANKPLPARATLLQRHPDKRPPKNCLIGEDRADSPRPSCPACAPAAIGTQRLLGTQIPPTKGNHERPMRREGGSARRTLERKNGEPQGATALGSLSGSLRLGKPNRTAGHRGMATTRISSIPNGRGVGGWGAERLA